MTDDLTTQICKQAELEREIEQLHKEVLYQGEREAMRGTKLRHTDIPTWRIFFNSGGLLGLLMALLFGWFPLFVVMAVMNQTTLSHEWSLIGLGLSYAISIPAGIVVCSVAAWKDGLVNE